MRIRVSILSLAVAAAGCFTGESQIQVGGSGGGSATTTRRGESGGRETGGGTSSGGQSSSSGTSSGGSSSGAGSSSGGSSTASMVMCGGAGSTGGSNLIFDCTNLANYAGDAGGCSADWLGSQVADFEACSPICGASVQAQTPAGVPIAGTAQLSDPATGTFHYCLPPDTTFEPTVTATGYSTFVYGEIRGQLAVDLPLFGMLSNEELSAFSNFLPGGGLNKADGALVAFLFNTDDCGGGNAGGASAGWALSLAQQDGGVYPDGGYVTLYIDSSGFPDPMLKVTSVYGVALLYNIDPSAGSFPTLLAKGPAGGPCQNVNPEVGFTGRVLVGPDYFSEQGIFIE
jgi:hypothetical protein